MKMSEEKRMRVYGAISQPIVDLRIDVARADSSGFPIKPLDLDSYLFALELKIWSKVKRALDLSEAP